MKPVTLGRLREWTSQPAVVRAEGECSYQQLLDRVEGSRDELIRAGVEQGDSVAVVGDFSPASIATLLALIELGCIVVPLTREAPIARKRFLTIAEADFEVEAALEDTVRIHRTGFRKSHPALTALRRMGEPGLVLFSSGSTGDPKAALHRLHPLLNKFLPPRRGFRTVAFLLFDHIGGLNTLFYTLANGGALIAPAGRTVAEVCRAVERHRAELLPTTPSFLNLLLASGTQRRFDLSSIELITYGAERMSAWTLAAANRAFPGVRFQQTYGLTEVGILRSKSAADDSLLVRIGGEDYETKIVDGTLRIRSASAMMGYLNAPSPFDEDGWLDTGDEVEREGEYYRILGRRRDVINVGGQKLHPTAMERLIAEALPEAMDVKVRGEPNLLLGETVVATVQVRQPISGTLLKRKVVAACRNKVEPFMIPTRIEAVLEPLFDWRGKKRR